MNSDDPRIEPDNKPLTSAKIVENIRMAMNKTTDGSTPVHAYIIPSVDAHFVSNLTYFTYMMDTKNNPLKIF